MSAHALASYVGKPWVAGARGPDAFDCWGLVWHVYKYHLGVELPDFDGVAPRSLDAARAMEEASRVGRAWRRLRSPVDLCVVAMGVRFITHVGLYLSADEGMILHAINELNVVADSPSRMGTEYGFGRLEYYLYGAHS